MGVLMLSISIVDLILLCLPDPGQSIATAVEMEDCACHICGKVLRRTSLRRHIIDRHFPSKQAPCQLCGKVFKTANSLSTHMNAFHKHFKKLPATSSHTWSCFIVSWRKNVISYWGIWRGHIQYWLKISVLGIMQMKWWFLSTGFGSCIALQEEYDSLVKVCSEVKWSFLLMWSKLGVLFCINTADSQRRLLCF
jgi:hypothetical protein